MLRHRGHLLSKLTAQKKQEVKLIYAYCQKSVRSLYTRDHPLGSYPNILCLNHFSSTERLWNAPKLALELRLLLGSLLILRQKGRKSRAKWGTQVTTVKSRKQIINRKNVMMISEIQSSLQQKQVQWSLWVYQISIQGLVPSVTQCNHILAKLYT